jgi:hypothetical protein
MPAKAAQGSGGGLGNIFYIYYNVYLAAILVKDIPDELRNLFKAICAEQGKTMREGIIELMREVVENRRKVRR